MQRHILNYSRAFAVVAGLLLAQPSGAAAPKGIGAPDKADMACLITLEAIRRKAVQEGLGDPKKQAQVQNMMQVVAFYMGKLTARHPGYSIADIASGMNIKSPEMYRLMDATRCANEFKALIAH